MGKSLTLMSASVQRLGPLEEVSKTSRGGRPLIQDRYGKFEMEDIEAIDSVPGTQRAKALALDLWWTALGHHSRVRIPTHIDLPPSCRAELTRRADALSAGGWPQISPGPTRWSKRCQAAALAIPAG